MIDLKIQDFSFNWQFKDNQTLRRQGSLEVNSILAAKAAALSGWGLVQALSYQVTAEIEDGSLVPVLLDYTAPRLPIQIIHNEGGRVSAKIGAFSKIAIQSAKSLSFL